MLKRSLESLVAGVCVYAAMAACSGAGGPGSPAGSGDAGGPVATEGGQPARGGAPSTSAAGEDSGLAGSPVPNAMAAGNGGGGGEGECGCQPAEPTEPKEPTVVEAECKQMPGLASMWAVAEVPGATDVDLSKVVAIVQYPEGVNKTPPGFDSYAATVYLKDGAVATACGPVSTPGLQATRVRFVLP
jgi:hypothetical protein